MSKRLPSILDVLPTCFVCKRQVDRVDIDTDFRTRMPVFSVFCHGQMEYFAIDPEIIGDIKGVGFAFMPQLQIGETKLIEETHDNAET